MLSPTFTVFGIFVSNTRICSWKLSVTSSVNTLHSFVLDSHMVIRMPAMPSFGLIRFLIFTTVRRKSCIPIIARSWGFTVIMTSSAAARAFIVNVPKDGHVSSRI